MMRRLMLVLTLAFWAGSARGEQFALAVHDVTVVQDGEGHARILFGVDELSMSDYGHLDRAMLSVAYSGEPSDRSMELRACPVTGSLTGGGDWNTPFEEQLYARSAWDLRSRSGTLLFDVTGAFRARRAAGAPLDGFVLTATGIAGGLPEGDVSRLTGIEGASIQVTTTSLPSGLPPQAWRERHGE